MPVSKRLRIANAQHCEWLRGAEHVSGAEIGDGAGRKSTERERSGERVETVTQNPLQALNWLLPCVTATVATLSHWSRPSLCIWGLISRYKMCMCSLSLINAERERSQECRQLTLTPWRLALPGSSQGRVSVSRQSRKLTTSRLGLGLGLFHVVCRDVLCGVRTVWRCIVVVVAYRPICRSQSIQSVYSPVNFFLNFKYTLFEHNICFLAGRQKNRVQLAGDL